MEIFGIGLWEVMLVLILALVVIGPKDLEKTGRTLGRFLNKLVHSPTYRSIQRTSAEIRNLPTRLMREANLEDLRDTGRDLKKEVMDPLRASADEFKETRTQAERTLRDTERMMEKGSSGISTGSAPAAATPPSTAPTSAASPALNAWQQPADSPPPAENPLEPVRDSDGGSEGISAWTTPPPSRYTPPPQTTTDPERKQS